MKAILIAACSLVAIYLAYRTYRQMTLDRNLEPLIRQGAIILDVRTENEFNTGHIEGSVNISLGTIRERYTELDPAKTYITTCSHGLRSVKAKKLLEARGFQKVYNGGAWADLEKLVQEVKENTVAPVRTN